MKTFIITLPEATERQEAMRAMMAKLGLPFEFFDAVDGRGFDVASHSNHHTLKRRLYFGRDLKGGEMGVLLSHKAIYQTMVDQNIPLAMVLEDDVNLHDDLPKVLEALKDGPQDFELIRFLGSPKVMGATQKTKRTVVGEYNLNRLLSTPGGAHAYVITLSGARKLLAKLERNFLPIDTLMGHSWATGVENLIINPGLSLPDPDLPQYIGTARFDKQNRTRGWTSLVFPLSRGWFKLRESLMKRFSFYKG